MKIYSTQKFNIPLHFIWVLIFNITFLGCKKDIGNSQPTNPPITNKPPNQFTISLIGISADTAAIGWTQAIDPEHDSVTYKIMLNDSVVISNYTEFTYVFRNLKELTSYNIKITATDSKQNQTIDTLKFITKKYWLRFLKKVEYGSISGYSSQKTGQMIKANDGNGYIIVGESELLEWPNGPFDMFAIKIDTLGNKVWQKFYDYSVGNEFEIKIVSNNANGYIICGGDNVIKISNTGDLIWRQSSTYSQLSDRTINGIAVDADGIIYAVGSIAGDSSVNIFEAILNKYDQQGNLIMSKIYSPRTDDYFFDIKINANNQLVVLGASGSRSPSTRDFWVQNLSKNGDIIWSNTYPNNIGYSFPENIIQTKEGNYVFTGFALGSYAIPYFYLQMIDANGRNVWHYYNSNNYTRAYSVSETNDNSLVVAGGYQLTYSMQSSLYKFDKNGNKLWEKLYPEFATYLQNKTVIPTNDGGYLINCQKSKAYNNVYETDQIYIYKTDDIGEFQN